MSQKNNENTNTVSTENVPYKSEWSRPVCLAIWIGMAAFIAFMWIMLTTFDFNEPLNPFGLL